MKNIYNLILIIVTLLVVNSKLFGNEINRPIDPIVISGINLPSFINTDPTNIVAFNFNGSWHQIPLQVDERIITPFKQVYDNIFTQMPGNVTFLAYADENTFTGADTNSLFDMDDEIAFMAFDAADQAELNSTLPAHVVSGSGIKLSINNPLNNRTNYVYLFKSDGTIPQDAGTNYITYTFSLASGNYKTTYNKNNGPNQESSIINSSCYHTEFSDRWIREVEKIYTGAADGIDILDRHRTSLPGNGVARNEETFTAAEGAFIANINGPIRAIRSYLGANSGPATQRLHIFYKQRQYIYTYLRVHSGITGPRATYNYAPTATNMTYYNQNETNGVSIDGFPDVISSNAPSWEMVTGGHGTLIFENITDSDIPGFNQVEYYNDNKNENPPTGSSYYFGMHGPWVNMNNLPVTDPLIDPNHKYLNSTLIITYEGINKTIVDAYNIHNQITAPLQINKSEFSGDSDGDMIPDNWELTFFSDLTHSATDDDDKIMQDGANNLTEYIAGTDPIDPSSFPKINISNTNNNILIQFDTTKANGAGYEGYSRFYSLKISTSLVNDTWEYVSGYSNIIGTNQSIIYTNNTGLDVNCYRTEINLH